MARKKPADAAKAKAAKQKKIVIGLGCVLALALAYAVNTMMSLNSGAAVSKPQAAPAATTPTSTDASAPTTPPASLASPTLAGSPTAAAAPAAPTDSSQLTAAVKPPPGTGQLESFSRFDSKDPFAGGAPVPRSSGSSAGAGSGASGTSGGSGTSGSGSGSTPAVPPAPPAPPPVSAVISVNGTSESVAGGSNFPSANPVASANGLFQLVSLTAKTAVVSVVGGSYASGSATLTLKVNKPVTLVNTADGTRYTLVLYPQGTPPPSAASSGASTGAPSGVGTTPTTPVVPSTSP